jgi:hypothetical protein
MSSIVKLRDIVDELEMLSDELHSYLNKQTGELITVSREELQAVEDELELYPDWQKQAIQKAQEILDSDDYLPLPNKFDIHEYSIMERFCNELENAELSDELLVRIRGSGAFRRFKHAIYHYNISDYWYRYRQKALENIAIDWLEANSISYEINQE